MSHSKNKEQNRLNWPLVRLGNVLKVKGRIGWKGYKTSDLRNEGPVVIGGTNVKSSFSLDKSSITHLSRDKYEESPEIMLKKGDIILVTRGNGIGDVGYYDDDFPEATINPSVVILSEFDGDDKYLFYYLVSTGRKQLLSLEGGSSIPAIFQSHIRELEIPYPSLKEQKDIGNIFLSLDNKIDLLRRQNQTLEQLAQTIFKQWFVHYQYPGATGEMEETELGNVPKGWRVGKLGDELDILMGQSPDGESYNENKEGAIFFQGRTDFGFRFPTTRLYTNQPKRMAEPFDTLVSVRAPVGDINMAYEKCCIGRGLAAVRSKYKSYAFYKMQSYKPKFSVFETEGTVFGSLGKDGFNDLDSIIPTSEIKSKFEEVVHPIDKQIYNLSQEIQTLTQLRDSLLPRLMSGKLRVG